MPGTGQSLTINTIIIASEVLGQAVRQEIEISGITTGNEKTRLSSFANDMVFYLESPREFTENGNHYQVL